MYATVKLEGFVDDILEEAVKKGLAKTKTEALRLGVLELNNKYGLLSSVVERLEDQEDVDYIRKARKKLASRELKLYGEKELKKALE